MDYQATLESLRQAGLKKDWAEISRLSEILQDEQTIIMMRLAREEGENAFAMLDDSPTKPNYKEYGLKPILFDSGEPIYITFTSPSKTIILYHIAQLCSRNKYKHGDMTSLTRLQRELKRI